MWKDGAVRLVALPIVLLASTAGARTLHGLVYDDANRDGRPTAGEPGIAGAVVALDVAQFVVTDARGGFTIELPDDAKGIVWVRVPDGFEPGPVWANTEHDQVDLGLHSLESPHRGPLTFVVAADTHISPNASFEYDLAAVARAATALDPPPAFFTILGDITQGNQDYEFVTVDDQLAGLGVPYVPVPGNHDWYDDGVMWKRHYGPDNYSFDIDRVHFIVWNMAMDPEEIAAYLGKELARVHDMTIVALTHAPPAPGVIAVLRRLGVAYVLTGHTHTNRVFDHDGIIELNTEPLLMGGLDFTPAGYRVVTMGETLATTHRTVVDEPLVELMAPAQGQCVSPQGGLAIVAAEFDAEVTAEARIDCGDPIAMRPAGGWDLRATLPALSLGTHTLAVEARGVSRVASFEVCTQATPPMGAPWSQLGGGADHRGARARELAPPVVAHWVQAIGGHALQAPPVIANGMVYVAATDLGRGDTGALVAIDLATGMILWRHATPIQLRGGPAIVGDVVAIAQVDGSVLGLDANTGAQRWVTELAVGIDPLPAATFASVTADGDFLVGNQRRLAAISRDGTIMWQRDPVPDGRDSQSLAAVAVGGGTAVGTFHRALGGVIAWDRATGHELWHLDGPQAIAINASPLVTDDTVFIVNGADEVLALELATGAIRWQTKLDDRGFDWGNATIGTPALAHGILVVPTLYGDLVALDALGGAELWRVAGAPSPLRTTHYRGTGEGGFEASPVITGDIVWAADTAGRLAALDLHTGHELWHQQLAVPVLAGLATSGDWLVVASYDGTVRAMVSQAEHLQPSITTCAPAPTGCCSARGDAGGPLVVLLFLLRTALRRRCAVRQAGPCYLRRRRRRIKPSARPTGMSVAGTPALHE